MSPDDIRLIVDQALTLLKNLYVHLPLKRAMHAVDPVQRLQLLRDQADNLRDAKFHREMVSIFKQLRDLHTIYILPQPYRSRVAFLPFKLSEYFEGEDRRYVVTRVRSESETSAFKVGVEVTHWNGTPIGRAIELNADREAGSNPEARLAQGLAALTQRHLAVSLPPDEEWVEVTYRAGGQSKTKAQRFEWQIFTLKPGVFNDPLAAARPDTDLLGLDVQAELERSARKLLFESEAVDLVKQLAPGSPDLGAGTPPSPVDFDVVSKIPDVFTFRKVKTTSGTFGYVRIHTFLPPPWSKADDIVDEFVRIVRLLPPNGLILDVRGNGGGIVGRPEVGLVPFIFARYQLPELLRHPGQDAR